MDEHYPFRPRVGMSFAVGASLAPTPVSGLITVTPPAAITTLDSVLASSFKAVTWWVQGVKATPATYYSQFFVAHDGTTPTWVESDVVLAPSGDPTVYDFTFTCDISGGNLRIRVTPSSTGWTFYLRKQMMSA